MIDISTTMIRAIEDPTVRRRLPAVRVEDDLGNKYRGESLEHYGAGWSGNAPAAHDPSN